MGINFPNIPVDGQLFTPVEGGPSYVYENPVWNLVSDNNTPISITGPGVITPEMFGAKGDGVSDDTTAIQAAINTAGTAPGADVYLAAKTYKITQTLDIPYVNVSIIGTGSDIWHTQYQQGQQPSTKLLWGGAHGGTMMHIRSPAGATNQQLAGGGVEGVYFDSHVVAGNDGAGTGLRISSRMNGIYKDLYFYEFRDVAILLDCVASLGDNRGCANNTFFNIGSGNSYANMDGSFIRLWGDVSGAAGPNVYFNQFFNCRPIFNTGVGYDFGNSDHNRFYGCSANAIQNTLYATPVNATISLANPCVVTAVAHGQNTGRAVQFVSNGDTLPAALTFAFPYYVTKIDNDTFKLSTTLANRIAGVFIDTSGGSQLGTHKIMGYSAPAILFRGSMLASNNARENRFYDFSGGSVIKCEGTETGLTVPSSNNNFTGIDHTNSTPLPTLGTGATSWVSQRDDGTTLNGMLIKSAFGGSALMSAAGTPAMQRVNARMTTESVRIANNGDHHMRFEVPAADYLTVTADWSMAVLAASGDLRLSRLAGSGNVLISGGGLRLSNPTAGMGYTTGAGGTATQLTDKTTVVTLNTVCGWIATAPSALAAGAAATFQFVNANLGVGDVLVLNVNYATTTSTPGGYLLASRISNGSAYITIRNVTAGSLSEAVTIYFAVIKGVIA